MIADPRALISAMMLGMIHRFGGHDAVAALLAARWGHATSKGTLTKKASGDLDWTLADVIALEDALGDYPISRMMAERSRAGRAVNLQRTIAAFAKEAGEAVSISLGEGTGAAMLKEAREEAAAAQALVEALEHEALQ